MDIFDLPIKTNVEKTIPKNAFDRYISAKQKKLFTDLVERIRWTNKLSKETLNLSGSEIKEIQIFSIDLKDQDGIDELMAIIDKSIPYPIIFCLQHKNRLRFSTSQKHPHLLNPDNSVIDWTFSSDWIDQMTVSYSLNLKRSLDFIFFDFCLQLSRFPIKAKNLADLVEHEQRFKDLTTSIRKLKVALDRCKQFNKKVELNIELQKKKAELLALKQQ
ncbi:DUF4391 domain-containing protein [Spirosoma lituiforme]